MLIYQPSGRREISKALGKGLSFEARCNEGQAKEIYDAESDADVIVAMKFKIYLSTISIYAESVLKSLEPRPELISHSFR